MAVFNSSGVRKGLTVVWGSITGIPARVTELAALGDPGADRVVVWDDSAGNIAYMDPAVLPYDNSSSGLAATTFQDAIDELAAAVPGTIYSGWVDASALGSSRLPSGWSVSNPSTGQFTITHGLGLSPVTDLSVVVSVRLSAGGADDRFALVSDEAANTFDVRVVDHGAGAVNDDFYFIAVL